MPYQVLKASGHVERFTDYIVYDVNNDNICHRADHLAKDWFHKNDMHDLVDQVDSWSKQELEDNINKYEMIKGKQIDNTQSYEPIKVHDKI
jgi:glycyl-tRNA synthetase